MRRRQDDKLIGMEAEADIVGNRPFPHVPKQPVDMPAVGKIGQTIADIGVGHPRKQRRHDAEGANAQPLHGLDRLQQTVGVGGADRGEPVRPVLGSHVQQRPGRNGFEGDPFFFEETA